MLLAFGYIATVVARQADVVLHLLLKRLGEIGLAAALEPLDQQRLDPVAGDIEKPGLPGGGIEVAGSLRPRHGTGGKEPADIDQGQGLKRSMGGMANSRGRHGNLLIG
ncbi:hypothetical protein D3C75_1114400 [compost metagenome]